MTTTTTAMTTGTTMSTEAQAPGTGDMAGPSMEGMFRLIQMTDSAFPVGTFSFSNGLETLKV